MPPNIIGENGAPNYQGTVVALEERKRCLSTIWTVKIVWDRRKNDLRHVGHVVGLDAIHGVQDSTDRALVLRDGKLGKHPLNTDDYIDNGRGWIVACREPNSSPGGAVRHTFCVRCFGQEKQRRMLPVAFGAA